MRGLRKGTKLKLSKEERQRRLLWARSFRGERNAKWRGDKVGYRSLHNWIENRLGKPHDCRDCGDKTLRHRQYQWANISGEYKRNIRDWKRLCVRCHVAYDKHIRDLLMEKNKEI